MENELSGVKGEKSVYVDTVGRVTEVLDQEIDRLDMMYILQ